MCLRRAATLFATCMYSVNHYCTMVVCGLQRYGFVLNALLSDDSASMMMKNNLILDDNQFIFLGKSI